MRRNPYRSVLVLIAAFIVEQGHSKVLRSSDFEDKDIPYLLNWNGNEEGIENVQLSPQSQPAEYQNILLNASQAPQYVPVKGIVQQFKQFQNPQSPFAYDSDDDSRNEDRNCGTPVKRPSDELSMMSHDDQSEKTREQSRAPAIVPMTNVMNPKGVTISIMVPFMDSPQNCKPPLGSQQQNQPQQCRQPLVGTKLDKGGKHKGKFKDKKERAFGKCAKKNNEQGKIFSPKGISNPKRQFNVLDADRSNHDNLMSKEVPLLTPPPSKDDIIILNESKKHWATTISPLHDYADKEPEAMEGLDQWKALDKILELNLRKREALESLRNVDESDYFDDHVVRNKRLLFFRRKNRHYSSQAPSDSLSAITVAPPVTTQRSSRKYKASGPANKKQAKSDGKRMKHFRLWKGRATIDSSREVTAAVPVSIRVDEANKQNKDSLMVGQQQQPLDTQTSPDQRDYALGGIQPNLK